MAKVRVRQHVNPLSQKYQTPVTPPNWSEIYNKPNQPLHLDIGCARGEFLLKMATLEPDWNFLGLEIREPLVKDANQLVSELGLKNIHYLFCNVNNSLVPILESFPQGILQRVTIQFPDPWFKKRQMKRRLLQPEVVNNLAIYLAGGGYVFLQSDVEEVEREMCLRFEANSAFYRKDPDWLAINPLPIPTERETYTISRGEPVYRALFIKD
ncbi:tRNA (guanosine(46)-N7)-methyltransferase TrmB [Limnofasciculus baicalensis]|uniref:tRNA (guanine-N(7)-)-methyltransferase n=1 Tax=Limnofasciculus baicalensis BBK-W-15 TaxID=2699891 RepID=A0AAE3GSH8_9CYAN|nr:tRNA (guanosine(46)-N7)-methyltransferase TrmB [Limnofasciculus baicalensis]MCP2729881.1 tRNA (guanosine(46)-N7)-methyltransferase TrmB [Limnofasciculus baicalensis BBK-W-15]